MKNLLLLTLLAISILSCQNNKKEVKENQSTLFKDCLAVSNQFSPIKSFKEDLKSKHGRIEQRSIDVFNDLIFR